MNYDLKIVYSIYELMQISSVSNFEKHL